MKMRNIQIGKSDLQASEIVLGCFRIADMSVSELDTLVKSSLENGINFFDHADIYGGGKSEELFGQVLANHQGLREKLFIQTKCGIRPGFFDFSKEHIINSVDKSLQRLGTDYVDTLLLHRPDTLMEPEEVAEAFTTLKNSGKVRHFGVSNQRPRTIDLLSKYIEQPIVANQLQFSITNTEMIDAGLNANMGNPAAIDREGQILEYCRLNDITIQAWSPYQYGFFEGVFIDSPKFPELNAKMEEIANRYNISKTTLATAWILRHPANMQVIVGTTKVARLNEICAASDIRITREEWYDLYRSAGNILP